MIGITFNGTEYKVDSSLTILEAAKSIGVHIPTLCHLEGNHPQGACRVCVVEVAGANALVASCSTPVRDGMVIQTENRRVREARKTVVDLMLSEHVGDCRYCDRGDDCELQDLSNMLGLREPMYAGETPPSVFDLSTPALVRDTGKCIKCRRCVMVCNEVQNVGALFPQNRGFDTVIGPAFTRDLDTVACVQCGQCAAVCPVGAITEKSHIEQIHQALDNPEKTVVVQTAPAIRAALGECFGYEAGTLVTGKMVTALKLMGFDGVFDTNFTADLTILEEGSELLKRLKQTLVDGKPAALPQFSSCSPGWIKYAEYFHPDFLPNLSTCKSPQQMFGALAKSYYAQQIGVDPKDLVVVSVMPCTAKKFEAARPEMTQNGIPDVDYVLTTRELGQMIRSMGIDFRNLGDSAMDSPFGLSSGAADIFANTGGVMEAALRTVYEIVTGRDFPMDNLHVAPITGLEGIKEASVLITDPVDAWKFLDGVEVKVAVAHGLGNTEKVMELIRSGEKSWHFVEIMTCPGGCIGGGGQPRFTDDAKRRARIAAIYREDEGKPIRKSHKNPTIEAIYADYLKEPLGERSHHLLHTEYEKRSIV
ncbi:NADH-dependent [FeFe] hydrogenase, group A6 [Spirochaeta isovalerica]|uniref:Iron-only hydrogenase group A n=1 Tax=Spirochaeta isovalerica TaxID=150 RepID=A0A841RBX2_9SPIO|nr:NADH-dependent [FeFe] hydrogenase, group A6 [Spirochaeta isovalerica]MBB6480727.1 iron-only hydrogenase group A [Spirochaeta isovalerica]